MACLLRKAVVAATCVVVFVGAGCSDDPQSTANPPITPDPTSSLPASTPRTIDVTRVPEVIDLGYVDAVLKAINHAHGEAARRLYEVRKVDGEIRDLLRAIYTSEEGINELANFEKGVRDGIDGVFHGNPGDPVTRIKSLLSSSDRCIVAAQRTDRSPFFGRPVAPLEGSVVQLVLKPSDTDPRHLNPSPWLIEFAGIPDQGQDLNRACERVQ